DVINNLATVLGTTSSLAFWIKTTQVGNNTFWSAPAVTGVEQTNGANDIGWGYLDASGHIGISVGNSGSVMSTTPINNGQWHHVAISRNASDGSIKLYIDGVLNKTGTLEAGFKGSTFKSIGQLTIDNADGTTRSGGNYFNGQLDDVRIYNQIIDPGEVNGLALAPAAPTNLVVTPASGTELDLSWTDVATTETGYKVERSEAGGPFIQIALLPAGSTSYDDVGLTQNVAFSYRVRATSSAGDSAYSNTVNTATPVAPITPTDGQPTAIGSTQISISWTDNASNELGIKVLRKVGDAQFAQVADLPPNTESYVDNNNGLGLTPGVSYDYHIQEYNIAGYSDFTGFTATTLATTPTGVTATPAADSVTISWMTSTGAAGYNLYRSTTPGGEGTTPFAAGITGTGFIDDTISPGQFYYYRVTSLNVDDDESPQSAEVTNNPSPPPQFAAPVGYATGTNAHGVTSADVNGDNILDLLVANAGASNVSVLLGNGDATFKPAVNYGVGTTPKMVAVKDVSGDNIPDLVTANQDNSTISVLINNGNGTFKSAVNYGSSANAHDLTIGDVDGDNDNDIVEVGWGASVVRVFRNNGTGTFSTFTDYNVGSAPHSVVLTNFNNDTMPDIAIADHGSNNIAVLLNNGTGGFGSATFYNSGTAPHQIRFGDFNGDTKTDLVTANDGSDNLSVFLGNGNGTFASAVNYAAGSVPKGVGIGDVNNDGKLDLISANTGGNYPNGTNPLGMTISVLLGNGDGTFNAAASFAAGDTPFSMAVADFDSDGDLDIATANWHGDNVTIIENLHFDIPQVNHPPVANPDSATTSVNIPVQINVLGNDTDSDGTLNPATVVVSAQPGNGVVSVNATTGAITYTPDANFTGNDVFGYTVRDNKGAVSGQAQVSVNVTSQPTVVYVSDLTPTTATNGYGPYEKDTSNGEQAAGDGHVITLNGTTYAKGLGVHANSTLVFNLNGQYSQFLSDIGVDDEKGNAGSVVFQVYLDNSATPIYDSGVMTGATATKQVVVDVTGKSQLKLVVTDSGNGNNSDHADWANARLTTAGQVSPPAAPTLATPTVVNQQVTLNWTEPPSNQTGFRIERKTGANGTYAQIADVSPSTTSFVDQTATSGNTYYYHVYAYNSGGPSGFSNEVSAVIATQTQAYLSDLTPVSAVNGWGAYEKDHSNNEQGANDGHTITLNTVTYTKGLGVHANSTLIFNLNGQYTQFLSDIGVDDEVGNNGSVVFQVYLDGSATPIYDSGVMTGATATKQVVVDVTGKSQLKLVVTDSGNGNNYDHADWANARLIVGQPTPPPAAPTSLTATYNPTTAKVDLTWTDSAGDQTGFRIERKLGASGTWAAIQTVSGTTFNYTDPTILGGNSNYFYRVFATNAGGSSAQPSNESNITTPTGTVTTYLSSLTPTAATNGWGAYEKDHSNGETGANDGHTITLNTVTYAKGLGVHAASDITFNLNKQYTQFLSDIGVDDEVGNAGSVVFQVYLDGVLAFDSGTMIGASATQAVNLNVQNVTTLRLVVGVATNGNTSDHADWAGARLLA
ncbi:MAG TPA: NPCBM/NEW2 domain-containing protein, partial [Tepidisphaeraceae bacterium]|nr:NPCBM/NEW2 domain-containing protein [Tepidisphaeraceae bacterium]